jgi:hypothetical protein
MSARRVNAQNPGSSIENIDGNGGCQVNPSAARNRAKDSSRTANGRLQNSSEVMSTAL